jgi:hypothetical protein
MAGIVHCHPGRTKYDYHIYTDLDFWDARRILKGIGTVKRNFGDMPPGDVFPTQVVGLGLGRGVAKEIERRIGKAIISPPRHFVVRSLVMEGFFEFDPGKYYPARWSAEQMLHFTLRRLPLEQGIVNSPFKTVRLSWNGGLIRVERVQREAKHDPVIRSLSDAKRRFNVPSCF